MLQRLFYPTHIVSTSYNWSVFHIIRRQETQKFPDTHQSLLFRITHKMCDPAFSAMYLRPAQLFLIDHLVSHRLYDILLENLG